MAISFNNLDSTYKLAAQRNIEQWIAQCAKEQGRKIGELNYIFCSQEQIHKINLQYLGHDYPTDVITFDQREFGVVSGDIFIGVDTVAENAIKYGAGSRSEMLRVMIHGVLHLCGYGDKTKAEQAAMRSKEDECLAKIFG